MKTAEDKKTTLQKEFEDKTPTIKNVDRIEYLQTYCAWLELQIEKLESYAKEHTIEALKEFVPNLNDEDYEIWYNEWITERFKRINPSK